jgi:hypothetical protein
MTRDLYNKYGQEFVASFKLRWPKHYKLVVYYEGKDPFPEEDEQNIEWRRCQEVRGWTEWMESVSRFPFMEGKLADGGYDIQHDARHVRKALTEMHGLATFGGKIWWIDSDFFTHADVPDDWLDQILPDDKFCAFAGRECGHRETFWMYSETGMIGFNSQHPLYPTFVRSYWEIFWSGLIFTQLGWHDCYGFDAVRHAIDTPEHFVDLGANLPRGTMHPIINSKLGECLDHKKGPRKKAGRSSQADLVVPRKEAYWLM